MKCIICGATAQAEEIKSDPSKRPEVAKMEVEIKTRAEADELSKWEHVQVTITRDGGRLELLSGDICPNEKLGVGDVALTKVA